MAQTPTQKNREEVFEEFLVHLEDFLTTHVTVRNAEIEVLYTQNPQLTVNGYIARGVVRIGKKQYTFRAEMGKTGRVLVESEAFWFHLNPDELQKYLEEVKEA